MHLLSKTLFVLFFVSSLSGKSDPLITLTDANHKEHLDSLDKGPLFLMFSAPWCGQCRRLKTTWSKLANEFKDTVKFATVDTAKEKYLQDLFAINTYPTLLFLKDGKMYELEEYRNIEVMKEFVREGHKTFESEDIPKEPTYTRSIIKSIQMLFTHLKIFLKNHPITGYTILAVLILFLSVSIWLCATMLKPEKDFLLDEIEEESKKKKKASTKIKVQ